MNSSLDRKFLHLQNCGAGRLPVGLSVLGFLLLTACALIRPAHAQYKVEDLTGTAVSEVGPYYQDVEDAIKAFRARNMAAARGFLAAARKKSPKLAPPEVMMTQLFLASNQLASARAEAQRAMHGNPQDPEGYLQAGDIASNEGRTTEAGLLYERAAKLAAAFNENPKRKKNLQMRAYSGVASVAEAAEQWQAARDSLVPLLKLEPNNAGAHQRLGRALFKLDQAKEAYQELKAAKANDKTKTMMPAEVSLAILYNQAGDKTNAEKFLGAALKRGAQDYATHQAAAQYYLQTNQLKEAAAQAEKAVQLDPQSVDAHTMRGVIARVQGDFKTSVANLEKAHLLAPGNFVVINHMALALAEMPDEASRKRGLEFAQLNSRQAPKSAEALATLGWVHYRLGNADEADRYLNLAGSSGNLTAESAYFTASLLNDRGRSADAARLLEITSNSVTSDKPFAYRQQLERLMKQLADKPKPDEKPAPTP